MASVGRRRSLAAGDEVASDAAIDISARAARAAAN